MGLVEGFLDTLGSVPLLFSLFVLLLVFLVSSTIFSSRGNRREPPGPTPLPVIGNVFQLDLKRPYQTFTKLSKKYGSVFTIYMGSKKVVVLTGYKAVKEALVTLDEDFGDRDTLPIVNEISQGHGIVWANGDSWREMRRFALTNLRDFGMGKRVCEDKITEECQHLIDVFKKLNGEPFDTTSSVNCAVSNIICSIVYGSRFEYDDPDFTIMVENSNKRVKVLGSPSIQLYNLFPRFLKWIPNRKEYRRLEEANFRKNQTIFAHLKETLDPQACRGFVDAFLIRQKNLQDSGITSSHFHEDNLLMTVANLFGAGTDTTATTLRWGLLFMAKYPNVQDQVQEELKRLLEGRQVQVEDRKVLHFTNAVIHEIQRLASIASSAIPHKTTRDVTFHGYFIKKGTSINLFLKSVLYDETQWEKPDSFYPAHFLNKDGKFVKRDAFMAFSAGRRVCLGESLARMELFLFFSSLLQHFRFTPPPGVSVEDLDLTPGIGLALSPSPHQLCAVFCA